MIRRLLRNVRKVFRSAITGRFVSKAFAKANPDTTVSSTIRLDD